MRERERETQHPVDFITRAYILCIYISLLELMMICEILYWNLQSLCKYKIAVFEI
jgi:hypothetical protein